MHPHLLDTAQYLNFLCSVKTIQGMMNTCWPMAKYPPHSAASSGQCVLEMGGVSMETPMPGSDVRAETQPRTIGKGERMAARAGTPSESITLFTLTFEVCLCRMCLPSVGCSAET